MVQGRVNEASVVMNSDDNAITAQVVAEEVASGRSLSETDAGILGESGLKTTVKNLVASLSVGPVWQGCNLPSDTEFQQAVGTKQSNSFEILAPLAQFEVGEIAVSPLKDPVHFPELGKEGQQKKKGKPGRPPKGQKISNKS
ncbi:unnamed protein product [Linum trigynum]|uniref:Uncharacterized protein n=1 Tax=Linum trigynum TaxID=586398 RepID=A0AAV2FSA0_9ROSI